ncbi:MAG: hypothetical protein EOO99_08310 [Pedobacter sp.]|nr:MAG: hypothetical protein EOO99_08310 [Pedobacter sp.]
MRNFHAAAVERRVIYKEELTSHPMECGWASEAIFFIIVEDIKGSSTNLNVAVEISADGINWIPEGSQIANINTIGHYFCKVNHFGNWLRVKGNIQGEGAEIKASVQLHLKS